MIIGFCNLKGGVGKSKLNSYFSTYLAYKQYNTVLVDCDVSQHTTGVYDDEIRANGIPLDVIQYVVDVNDPTRKDMNSFVAALSKVYDFVVVDMPGTVQQDGVIEMFALFDYIIVPTTPEEEDLHSTKLFVNILDKIGVNYNVMMNNYEVQYFSMGAEESNNFDNYQKLFNDKVLPLGVRKERSLLQQNFALGKYGDHKNTKRVELALDEVLKRII